jgi:hypothetical protein
VSRGGRISRAFLIIGSELSYAVAALAIARLWDVTVVVTGLALGWLHRKKAAMRQDTGQPRV